MFNFDKTRSKVRRSKFIIINHIEISVERAKASVETIQVLIDGGLHLINLKLFLQGVFSGD